MGRLIAVLIVTLVAAAGWSQSPAESFKKGNAAYAAGQFSVAVTHYETARGEGLRHWILHYNLGNAYYKSGQTGRAIASYLRAFRMNSNQRDVIYNLNLVSTKAGDPFLPTETLAGVFWRMFYLLQVDSLMGLATGAFLVICIGGILIFLGRWRTSTEVIVGKIVVLAVFGGWCAARIILAERPEGVIISGTAEIRGAPTLTAAANFTLPEGRRVLILKEQEPIQGWLEIGIPHEGLKGWVPETALERL